MSSQHRKRLRKNIAASISDASEQSDAEVEQINVFPNSPEDESAEEKEGDAPPAPVPTHHVNAKTKCWLFSKVPAKGTKNDYIMNCFVGTF